VEGKQGNVRRRLYIALGIFVGVIITATLGYVALGWTLSDAIYMTIITVYGVGYGEIEPVDTQPERIFTLLVIIGGTAAIVYAIGEFVRFVAEGEIQKALGDLQKNKRVEEVNHHTIICGFGRIGQILAKDLLASNMPFVIVDTNEARVGEASALGYLVVHGSATEEETLVRAGIQRADVLTSVLPADAINVFITLTARNLNKDIRIIARGEQPSTEKKLLQAGANEVILPAAIGALRISHSIQKPSISDFLGDAKGTPGLDLRHLGIEVHEISLIEHGHLAGLPVSDLVRRSKGDLMVIAVRRGGGEMIQKNFSTLVLAGGDTLIVVGRAEGLPEFLRDEVTDSELP